MNALFDYLAMGGFAWFIWPAYAFTLRGGLDHSLQLVFWAVAAAGLVGLFTAWRVPEVAPAKPAAG